MRQYVTVAELRVGLQVAFMGSHPSWPGDVTQPRSGHPGTVHDADPMHVRVSWVGLEGPDPDSWTR